MTAIIQRYGSIMIFDSCTYLGLGLQRAFGILRGKCLDCLLFIVLDAIVYRLSNAAVGENRLDSMRPPINVVAEKRQRRSFGHPQAAACPALAPNSVPVGERLPTKDFFPGAI